MNKDSELWLAFIRTWRFHLECWHFGNSPIMSMMGFVDTLIELDLIRKEIMNQTSNDWKMSKAEKGSEVEKNYPQKVAHFIRMKELVNRCIELMEVKNKGYTGLSDDPFSNFSDPRFREFLSQKNAISESYDDIIQGILTRFGDKVRRLQNITYTGSVDFDSVEDTIMDGINYLLILHSYLTRSKI